MSEPVVNETPFSEELEHPPSKRIKLDPQVPSPNPSSPSNNAKLNNKNEDKEKIEFDPVQAILEAGKKCQEEEAERQRKAVDEAKRSNNNNQESEEDVVSLTDSESESDDPSDGEVVGAKNSSSNKSETVKLKPGKKKSSNMRRNIKDILKPDQLDDLTIAARKEEEERIQRIQLKQQQLKLLQLQQQQSQLLRESLSTPVIDTYRGSLPNASALFADNLMRRLIEKKHITVSLNESGVPQQVSSLKKRTDDDDCILLSSDEEADKKSKTNLPSHTKLLDTFDRDIRRRKFSGVGASEVIALSSGEEDNLDNDGIPTKDAHLYDGAGKIGGRGSGVDGESDDDCVIISPGPDGEDEAEEDKDECSQDLLNVPDNQGRVLVNVGHPDGDDDVFLAPQIARIVKPHQIGGIRFLYDNVVESVERFKNTAGFGCILAHAMGLGKTLQTVSFCDVVLRTVGKTILIIVPINTIQNWLNEFNRYLPSKDAEDIMNEFSLKKRQPKNKISKKEEFDKACQNGESTEKLLPEVQEDLSCKSESVNNQTPESSQSENNSTATEDSPSCSNILKASLVPSFSSGTDANILYRKFDIFLLNETVKSLQAREKTITTWAEKGGVLLIGYEMYRMLALKKLKKSTRKAMTLVHEERLAEAKSLDKIYTCLVDPGPDCVICDEGHRIKNSGAGISQALKAIKTKRRVVLTGYPLQNNLMEYWCMVDFVRPNYLGTKAEFSNMFERPIQNGQCADSTYEDKRLMKYRSHVLHSLLEGFVQRRSHIVLRNALPPKEEWVFLVRLTPIQLKIYREFIRYLRDDLESDNASTNPIKAFAVCCKIWNHPDVLYDVVKKNLDLEMDLDIDEVKPVAKQTKPRKGTGRPRGRPPLNGLSYPSQGDNIGQFDDGLMPSDDIPTSKSETSGISLEWAKPLFENYTPEVMENGVKFELLFELIEETIACGDKLLVFSQSLLTLDLIEVFLKKRLSWKKFHEYVRLDGSTAGLEREKLINEFNKSNVQKVFLISTRAGSLGINLVGANRVCIMDSSWNPCHDSQAVCRVYRYGQTKPCHIYRFVADCTLEKRIYDRQVNKRGMADRIVDEMNPNTPFKSKDVSSFLVLQHDLLEKLPYIKCDVNESKYGDPVMKNLLRRIGPKITQEPFEHESLLIDQKHQKLSKSEKRLALKNYEKEKQTVANAYATYSRPSYAQYYSSIGMAGSSSPSTYSYTPPSSSVPRYSSDLHHHRSYATSHSKSLTNSVPLSSSDSYGGYMGNSSYDRFELHINALKSRGISVFPVQLHQDTFLNDPSGASNIYIRAGERVYILVSQKGTYLRVQGKLLRVPFIGQEMDQAGAERFVMSLLQVPSASANGGSRAGSQTQSYPVEQQLPPSNNLLYQKNANHLQITNSTNNTGGDVMVGSDWNNSGSCSSNGNSDRNDGLPLHLSSVMKDGYSSYHHQHGNKIKSSGSSFQTSQSDLQSLSRLTETFCQRSSPYSSSENTNNGNSSRKQWSPSPSLTKYDPVVSPPLDLEVIKLNHRSQSSSNSSNSSNSRTNSPYGRQAWNNHSVSNDGNSNSAWGNKDPSFYTDFTITPLSRNNASASSSPSSRHSSQQPSAIDNYWSPSASGNRNLNTSNSNDFYSSTPPSTPVARDVSQHLQRQESSFHGFGSTSSFGHSTLTEMANSHLGIDNAAVGVNNESQDMNIAIAGSDDQSLQGSISNYPASSHC